MTDYSSQSYASQHSYSEYSKLDDAFSFETADFTKTFDLNGSPLDDLDDFDRDVDLAIDPLLEVPVNFNDLSFVRSDTPTRGVPSTFTVSSASESFQDSHYTESLYSFAGGSPASQYTDHSLTLDAVDEDMHRLGIHNPNETMYLTSSGSDTSSPGGMSLSMATFSPNPGYPPRQAYSDYQPSHPGHIRSSASEYHPHPSRYTQQFVQATVTPSNVSAGSQSPSPLQEQADPKKKFLCTNCGRGFARHFNLKTHMQTHDPNRAKPFACSHKGCGRAFSRKHDLMRHLTSIHRSSTAGSPEAIGVGNDVRSRCEDCGKSVAGKDKEAGCDCNDVK
ncbi:hypothetical protein EIP91_002389 [Steccherinum ochraceum]|uniref:C2H2-type domain-containing protein n=1 Tax=Steccherinum ochraceum TaxID=92696 RepID=A0A4V2MXM1_9APHY|nr:hypothetical protein EIP91_002389 [Steccherinum ochraceum]